MGNKSVIEKQGKWTREEVKDYLIDKLVDKDGNKVSIRTIFRDKYFMEQSGFYKVLRNGKRKPVSEGTISYWIEEFGITEIELYRHHKTKTKRIKCTFDEFTMRYNKNSNGRKVSRVEYDKYAKENLIKVYNRLCEKQGRIDEIFSFYPLNEIITSFEILLMLEYMDDFSKFSKDFHSEMRKLVR